MNITDLFVMCLQCVTIGYVVDGDCMCNSAMATSISSLVHGSITTSRERESMLGPSSQLWFELAERLIPNGSVLRIT